VDGADPVFIEYNTDLEEYWNVNQDVNSSNTFTLGTDGTFGLTTFFPNTFPSYSGNINAYEHFIYTPQCPDLPDPTLCVADPGDWDFVHTDDKGEVAPYLYLESDGIEAYGDFIVAIPDGLVFYSIADGDWDDSNTWSHQGYGSTVTVAAGIHPGSDGRLSDNVYIGDEKIVTIPVAFDTSMRYVRMINVEDVDAGPGELYIEGDVGYIRVMTFSLGDDCLLAVQNLSGITHPSQSNQAAVRMRSGVPPTLGVSRYMFYGDNTQVTSALFPTEVDAIIIDNAGTPFDNSGFISIVTGYPDIEIHDSIQIDGGIFNCNDRSFSLNGNIYLDNDGEFVPRSETISVFGDYEHEFRLDNSSGLQLFNLTVDFDPSNKLMLTRPVKDIVSVSGV